VIRQQREETQAAENAQFMTTEPEKTFHEIMVAIRGNLSNSATSDDAVDGEN
jgi:hypothetical protein